MDRKDRGKQDLQSKSNMTFISFQTHPIPPSTTTEDSAAVPVVPNHTPHPTPLFMPYNSTAAQAYQTIASDQNGCPLLAPEPNENAPIPYKETGVRIGDFGLLRNGGGAFEYIFNACLPADDPVNAHWGYHSPGTVISSATAHEATLGLDTSSTLPPTVPAVAGSSVKLSFRSRVGAVLVLPNGATREDLLSKDGFRKHVQEQAEAWYTFAVRVGFWPSSNPNDKLFVVTGCDKTSAWALASASSLSGSIDFNLDLSFGAIESSIKPKFDWQRSASATVRMSEGALGTENQ
ncbi:Tkl tkl-ccin protein kinase [Mycena chlorophos]|uniref:Tkl tkl-ccin protein kinase n=1 Tax=Mycena chlorophos TaxID=658473 RepID=A0A8H6S096_MYCCL|nr:Tkl tkl-ccin protein kinase [Mycena chlorophos]